MSYATALTRMQEIEARLGISQPAVDATPRNFDRVLKTAQSRFEGGVALLDTSGVDTMSPTSGDDATLAEGFAGTLGARGAAARSVGGLRGSGSSGDVSPALEAVFQRAAAQNRIPVALLKAVARAESGFRADATSPAGAQGMMQLMPATGRGLGVTNPFDPVQSINGGARYLSNALRMFNGDVRLAVASYNAGTGAVRRYGGVPPYAETQAYVTRVLDFARSYGLQSSTGTTHGVRPLT